MSVEFKYLTELAEEFFSRSHTQKSLRLIDENEISGWEIWIQVEFSYFLSMHITEPEWGREVALDYDRRSEKNKKFLRPDFLIRKKGWRRESYFALEFKQHTVAANCISNMVKDMHRVEKLRRSTIDLRSYWLLGIYKRRPKSEINELITNALSIYDYKYHLDSVVNKVIQNTPYGYCIF